MPSINELGQKVKAKYPGQYDDLDDAEVGKRVKAKFPGAYDDFSEAPAQPKAAAPAPKQPSLIDRAADTVRNGPSVLSPIPGVGSFDMGAAKGALSTLYGADKALRSVPYLGKAYSAVAPPRPPELEPMIQQATQAKGGWGDSPQSLLENAGKATEQAAEFAAPGGVIGKAGKAMELAAGASKLGRVAAGVGKAGLEAASAAGITGAQTGGNTNAMLGAGLTTGALSGAGQAVSSAAPALKELAQKQYYRAINPTTIANKAVTRKVVPELLNRRVLGSLDSLSSRAGSEAQAAGQQVGAVEDRIAQDPNAPLISLQPAYRNLSDLKNELTVPTNGGMQVTTPSFNKAPLKNLGRLREDLDAISVPQNAPLSGVPPLPPQTEFPSAMAMRRTADTTVANSRGFAVAPKDKSKAEQARALADGLRESLNTAHPDLAAANKEFSFWRNVGDVTDASVLRKSGQAEPLYGKMAQLAGLTLGNTVTGKIGGALALKLYQNVTRSPLWSTASAVTKNEIANMMQSGQYDAAVKAISRLSAAGISQAQGPPTPPE